MGVVVRVPTPLRRLTDGADKVEANGCDLAETEGIFTETAGGVVISCLKRLAAQKVISKDDVTVVYITGNGLKTQEVVEHVVSPIGISPTFDSFETAFGDLNIL